MAVEGTGWRELLTQIGIDPGIGLAGFWGSVVSAIQMQLRNPAIAVGRVVSGTVISIYITDPFSQIIHLPSRFTAFFVGYMGITALEWVVRFVSQRLFGVSPGGNGGPKDAAAK